MVNPLQRIPYMIIFIAFLTGVWTLTIIIAFVKKDT